ncbi:hypothetical protein J4G37_00025 [Microvirga sp. 3-52]|nr:hypothetical protein [Microvirga sp. 3-52]
MSFRRIELPVFYGVIDGCVVQRVKFDSRTMKGGLVDLRPPQSPAENPLPFVVTGLVPVIPIR